MSTAVAAFAVSWNQLPHFPCELSYTGYKSPGYWVLAGGITTCLVRIIQLRYHEIDLVTGVAYGSLLAAMWINGDSSYIRLTHALLAWFGFAWNLYDVYRRGLYHTLNFKCAFVAFVLSYTILSVYLVTTYDMVQLLGLKGSPLDREMIIRNIPVAIKYTRAVLQWMIIGGLLLSICSPSWSFS